MYSASQLYAGGLDVVSLRCCLVLMVSKMWSAGVVDIKTAFLNAELEKEDLGTKRVVIRTPALWRRLGVCEETFWDAKRAMYGLQISPAAWSRCRDRKRPSLKLMTCAGLVRLLQSDPNIWAIVPADLSGPVDPAKRLGLLLVYMDDIMVLSTPPIITDIIAELGKTWELSNPELGNVHYRGVEIRRGEGGILVHQDSYTRELLSRYPDKGGAEVPALRPPDVTPVTRQDPQTVRQAQQVAGELLWLSDLTRPDLQYGVGAISRMIAVDAQEAFAMGEQAIKYLRRYPARGLWYGHSEMSWGEEGDLSQPMGPHSLVGFSDASFAPQARRSIQSTPAYYSAGLVAWSSTKQGLTTLSTAESELVGITSLFTDLCALEPLVQEIHGHPLQKQMHSDSQAAIAICNTPSNNWRTRHLRLRAAYVREALESGLYSLHHVNGLSMTADIGTKPLPATRFQQLVAVLGMSEPSLTDKNQARAIDGSLEANVRLLLACLVVASLLDRAEAQKEGNSAAQALSNPDWQFLVFLVVITICCWEALKYLVRSFGRGCWYVLSQTVLNREGDRSEVHVVQYVDDVVILGPQHAVEQHLVGRLEEEEVSTASERPGAPAVRSDANSRPRRRATRPVFQLHEANWENWPAVLNRELMPVGQDRYEYRPERRTVLRWHVDQRLRLFCPLRTTSPVDVSRYTGRRRTWVIDVSEDSPNGRRCHVDNWRHEQTAQAFLPYVWIGCTELEMSGT